MEFAFDRISARDRYRLLTGLVVPRPIALVTTRSAAGVDNAAPYSFFNVLGSDPAIVVVSVDRRPDGRLKDTGINIAASGEFCVNLVDEAIGERMHRCAGDLPPEESEPSRFGLAVKPCSVVACGRLADSPANLECRRFRTVLYGRPGAKRHIVLGEVVHMHVRDDLLDPATGRVRDETYRPIGRFYGNLYCHTRDRFVLPGGLDGDQPQEKSHG